MDPVELADRAAARERANETLRFHASMRRNGRVVLALCALTFALSAWGVFRDLRLDSRLERLERMAER